tara:strand:+ start:4028 stop:4363 length:336 start_codon:yes stop_codon:yes gene_type:complete
MKPLEPKFEIYEIGNKYLVRYYHGVSLQKHLADSMENALRFIQSFYEKRSGNRVVQFKKSDAEKPRHPYDRDENYWLSQEEEDKYRENQEGMTTQTQYDFTLEDNDDKTDG